MRVTSTISGPSRVLLNEAIPRSIGFPRNSKVLSPRRRALLEDHDFKPSDYRPNIPHPQYQPDEIMDFRDRSARLPPVLAERRRERLNYVRDKGLSRPSRERPPLPVVPVVLEREKNEKVQYQTGKSGVTHERLAYESEEPAAGLEWGVEEDEMIVVEPGRVVEVRRSGQTSLGMILASVVMSGKSRYLLLRATGEIWPISANDIQFLMPSSLIQPSLSTQCWSPELLELWAQGDDASGAEIGEAMQPMQEARRKVVMVLRKIMRETEKMCGKMMGNVMNGSALGGMEGLWERLAPADAEQRGSVSSARAAEIILGAVHPGQGSGREPFAVKPNTLPAYAAHTLLMGRSDLFLADSGDMASSGIFMVRSRAERERLDSIGRLINPKSLEDQDALATFLDKARKIVQFSQKLKAEGAEEVEEYKPVDAEFKEWTAEDKEIITSILAGLYETRSTQRSKNKAFAVSVMKLLGVEPDVDAEGVAQDALAPLMIDMGIIPPWDTLRGSIALETEARARAMIGVRPQGEDKMLAGNELDDLREDFSTHKVFVVDEASALELDDGIAIERVLGSDAVWLHAHIADPTRYIAFDSPIAQRAAVRASSVYLPEGMIPLFPLDVIMKELSLGAKDGQKGGSQATMVFSTKISPTGEMLDYKVRMGWIKNPRLTTYSAVDDALGVHSGTVTRPFGVPNMATKPSTKDGVLASEDVEELKLLQKYVTAYRHRRLQEAGLEFENLGASISVVTKIPGGPTNLFDPAQIASKPTLYAGEPIISHSVSIPATGFSGIPSRTIIAEMMILAGRAAARFCGQRGLPAPFRASQMPSVTALPGQRPITLDQLLDKRDKESGFIDIFTIAGANLHWLPADVSLTPKQHWAMGFTDDNGYLRATSPLRRFEDMLVHWQIKSGLAAERGLSNAHVLAPQISAQDITTLSSSSAAQRAARKASHAARDSWEAKFYVNRLKNPRSSAYTYGDDAVDVHGEFVGRILGPTVYGTTSAANTTPVYIPSLGLKARMPGSGRTDYAVGQEVKVKIAQAMQWPVPIIDLKLVE